MSTVMWRFRPLILYSVSQPGGPPLPLVFTD